MKNYLVLALVSFLFTTVVLAEKLMVGEQIVHPGCVYELETNVAGDNIVASVNLTKTLPSYAKGCLEADSYSQEISVEGNKVSFRDEELFGTGWFSYEVIAREGPIYALRTVSNGGGSGNFASVLFVKVETTDFYLFKKDNTDSKKVTTLRSLGRVDFDSIYNKELIPRALATLK